MNKNTFPRSYTSNSTKSTRICDVNARTDQMISLTKMTTDSDSECSYVANLADFNVMRVIIIVIVIKIIVIK